jgi:hypothetical protein
LASPSVDKASWSSGEADRFRPGLLDSFIAWKLMGPSKTINEPDESAF